MEFRHGTCDHRLRARTVIGAYAKSVPWKFPPALRRCCLRCVGGANLGERRCDPILPRDAVRSRHGN